MNSTTYVRRKAAGLCPNCGLVPGQPGFVRCPACRFLDARRKNRNLTPDQWQVHEALRQSRAPSLDAASGAHIPGPAVGHCGAWQPVTALPLVCGRCGAVVLEEDAP